SGFRIRRGGRGLAVTGLIDGNTVEGVAFAERALEDAAGVRRGVQPALERPAVLTEINVVMREAAAAFVVTSPIEQKGGFVLGRQRCHSTAWRQVIDGGVDLIEQGV